MKDNLEDIDALIKETLSSEEALFYDALEEKNIVGKLLEVYRGKLGWLAIIMNIVHLLIFGAFLYCLYRFLGTEETNSLIKWTAAGCLCIAMMVMLKLYFWMQMDKNDLLREIKRLELQIANLSARTEQ